MTQRAGEGSTSSKRKTVERERHRVERVRSIDRPDPPHLPSWLFACHVWGQGGGAGGRFFSARSLSLHPLSRKPFSRIESLVRAAFEVFELRRAPRSALHGSAALFEFPSILIFAACRAFPFGLCSSWLFFAFRLRVSLFFCRETYSVYTTRTQYTQGIQVPFSGPSSRPPSHAETRSSTPTAQSTSVHIL